MSAEDIEYMDDYKEFPTKESALDWLDYYLSLDERNNLIRALEQEPCEDAISRQAVIDINEHHHGQMPNHVNHEIWEEIKALPPITPQPKTGHWIEGNYHIRCSECGEDYTYSLRNYCPNCGAKMQEVEE